jgi:hypothetical protein
MKGGLPEWFEMTDERVRSAQFHVWLATVLVIALSMLFAWPFGGTWFDAVLFCLSLIMLGPFIYGPAAIFSAAVFPTFRLRLFWGGLLLPVAVVWLFWQMPDKSPASTNVSGVLGLTTWYFVGWSLALAMPEFTLAGRYFPHLRFVDAGFFQPPPRKGFSQ